MQSIDESCLRSAAEHLEQVLGHYPNHPQVHGLLEALALLSADEKAGIIREPLDRRDIPGGRHRADGTFRDLRKPNVESAFGEFATALRGGRTDREKGLLRKMAAERTNH